MSMLKAMRLQPLALGLLLVFLVHVPARAQEFKAGSLTISKPWSPLPPKAAPAMGGFMTITNTGSDPDTLVGATTSVAGRVEVHEMSLDGGIMRMRELKPGLVIKPGETVVLKPGSFHLMLFDIKERPEAGQAFKGTLVFEKAGRVDIEFKVEPFGTRVPGDGGRAMPPNSSDGGHGHGAHK